MWNTRFDQKGANRFLKQIARALRKYLITGILLLLPIAVTVYLFWLAFSLADNALGSLVALIIGRRIPGVGVILTVTLIIGLGIFATNVVGRKIIVFFERLLTRIPIARNIYNAVKQLIDAFTFQSNGFKQVVMVEFPRKGMYSVGFLTNEHLEPVADVTGKDIVSVFIPTIPNVTTGFFIALPRDEVTVLDIGLEDGFKMMMSSGVIAPEDTKPTE